MTNLIGKIIDRKYRVVRILGEGGMGIVYEAEHTFISRRVAIKVLHPEYNRNEEIVTRFFREAQAASAIGHPNIVEIEDVGRENDGTIFIIMELLEGQGLDQLILDEGTLKPNVAVIIAIQMLSALTIAHNKGIVHRDLKPDNVFISVDGRGRQEVKILDFGIAKIISKFDDDTTLTKIGTVIGTPKFMSPEQAGGALIDGRADLWAVGVLLYEMLTGVLPFEGDSYDEIIHEILMKQTPSLRDTGILLPDGLISVVEKALSKDIDSRFDTAQQMIDALIPYCEYSSEGMTTEVFEALPVITGQQFNQRQGIRDSASKQDLMPIVRNNGNAVGASDEKSENTTNSVPRELELAKKENVPVPVAPTLAHEGLESFIVETKSTRPKGWRTAFLTFGGIIILLGSTSFLFPGLQGKTLVLMQAVVADERAVNYRVEKLDVMVEKSDPQNTGVTNVNRAKPLTSHLAHQRKTADERNTSGATLPPLSSSTDGGIEREGRDNNTSALKSPRIADDAAERLRVSVTIQGTPRTARVYIQGRELKLPIFLTRSNNPTIFKIGAPGYLQRKYTIIPDKNQTLEFKLKREPRRKPQPQPQRIKKSKHHLPPSPPFRPQQ